MRAARSVWVYGALACVTIAAGLASRRFAPILPTFIASYAGDTLWAALVFWLLALTFRRTGTARLAVLALGIAFAGEISQLYHTPWLDGIRSTRLGALVLGSGFLASDLVCYTVGVAAAAALDLLFRRGTNGLSLHVE